MDVQAIRQRAEAIAPFVVEARRAFHRTPELGGKEAKTQKVILRYLEKMGIETITYPGQWAVVGIIRGGHSGKTIGLRADMDGLPVTETLQVPFSSENPGVMHACGHDAHMAIALGAAKLLQESRELLHGNVKLFFEPAEETTGGGRDMVAAGCMEDPHVDGVIALHMCPDLPPGEVIARPGPMSGASDDVAITIKGKGAHGAYPERGVDAILIAAQVVTALQSLVSRNTSPLDSAVLSLGSIHGGTAGNVICDQVTLRGTLRTLRADTRALLKDKIRQVVSGVAAAMGGSGETALRDSYEAIHNDEPLYSLYHSIATDMLGPGKVHLKEMPSMGVESFGFFQKEAQGLYYDLGCGRGPALHSCDFAVDESCLPIGVALQTAIAMAYLKGE